MGAVYHNQWTTNTRLRASEMTPPLSQLDKAIVYCKPALVHCDGVVSYNKLTGVLSWSDVLRILFVREDGQSIQNTVNAGSITIADNQFAYVDLNETNNTVLTVAVATVSTGSTSNFSAVNRLVLGYRNTVSDQFYPVNLTTFLNINNAQIETFSSTKTINVSTCAEVVHITLTDNMILNAENGFDGRQVIFRLKQDSNGNRAITWGSMFRFSSTVPEPTLSTDANKVDYITFRYNAADAKYDCMSVNKGF